MAGRHLALVGLWGAQVRTEIDGKPTTGILEKLVSPSRWDEMSRKKENNISEGGWWSGG